MAKALTVKGMEAIKPGSSRREIADGGLPGLYLVVQTTGAMSWAIRYRAGNRARKMTIGSYPVFSLAQAREAARAALRTVAEGKDPGADKIAAEAFRADTSNLATSVLDDFVKRHVKVRNRASTARETERFIDNDVRPKWKHRLIHEISRRDIIQLLDDVATDRPISANRIHAILRRFFNWCLERDIIETSPVANVKAPSETVSRDRVLSADEIRLMWAASNEIGWPFGPMVRLLLITGQRRDEVASAKWSEFDLEGEKPTWIIPKERAKNGKEHVVPLSPPAVEILKALPRVDGKASFVLTTTGETPISGFSRAKASLDRAMLAIAQKKALEQGNGADDVHIASWTLHDLRRTCASGMAALSQPVHIVEAVLNHKSGSIKGVAAVYNRYEYADEKRRALSAWANHISALGSSAESNVIRIRKIR